ncbi:MAG: glycosyltransferase family 4 protein [Nevskiales bacterium]
MHKVWFVNRYFHPDGSATSNILSQLATHLAERGWQCGVVTSRQLYEAPRADLPRAESWRGVHIYRLPATRFGRTNIFGRALDYFTFYLAAVWYVVRHVRPGDTVVAKTDPPMLGLALALPCWLRRARLINWLQDIFPEIASRLSTSRVLALTLAGLRPLRDFGLRRAGANVVVGRCMQEYLAARHIPSKIICNWADEENVRPAARLQNPLRQTWGLGNSFVVGYSGNFGRAHVFEAVAAAGAKLAGANDLIFLMIGGGKQFQALQQMAHASGFENWMFRPYQPASVLSDSLGAADVHLVTQHPELSGVVVPSKWYGIAAAGRPAIFIGPRDAEIARVIAEEQCGWQLDPGDADGLFNLLNECRSNLAECARRGARAREAYERRFRRELSFAAWRNVIDR